MLDAVCHYLPDPSQRAADKQAIGTQKDPLIAYAFKVVCEKTFFFVSYVIQNFDLFVLIGA